MSFISSKLSKWFPILLTVKVNVLRMDYEALGIYSNQPLTPHSPQYVLPTTLPHHPAPATGASLLFCGHAKQTLTPGLYACAQNHPLSDMDVSSSLSLCSNVRFYAV